MKRTLLLMALLGIMTAVQADNWDYVRTSNEYYWGMGHGGDETEATEMAMSQLAAMIATHVSNDFIGLTVEKNQNGSIDHQTLVRNCVKTYAQATLTNMQRMTLDSKSKQEVAVGCYIKKSELSKIFSGRIEKAKTMVRAANRFLESGKVDMALQHYYWAYALVRSLQFPNEVKDAEGNVLIVWLPARIREVLSDVTVKDEGRDGDRINLLVNYKGRPASSLSFNYNDGRITCTGATAKDGRGAMEMVSGYQGAVGHVDVEYEFREMAQGDEEMRSVLNVVARAPFPEAAKTVGIPKDESPLKQRSGEPGQNRKQGQPDDMTGVHLKPSASQIPDQMEECTQVMDKVLRALRNRSYTDAYDYFTDNGLDVYNRLIGYGTGRIVGTPDIQFFKSADSAVVARGLQMSFSFKSGTKKTFVEDVVFTFDKSGKIDNVAFGLGNTATNDILCKHPDWQDEMKETIMEFLENYKTAYCLKRLDYIREIIAGDATIIVGRVARRATGLTRTREIPLSSKGQDIVERNKYTKEQYIENLGKCFDRNEFINIQLTNNDIQWLNEIQDIKLFGIQIGQEWNSSTYADKGYLYLMVDLTNRELPQIKVRTWQPNEIDISNVYHAGDFYK